MIYFLYSKFRMYQRDLNKKFGSSVKGNHDRAEKYISLFKAESDRIFSPFISARSEKKFDIAKVIISLKTY